MALLAVGSVVLTVTRSGASAAVGMDDVRSFFQEPSPVHLWFYLLFAVLALYALNTVLATWKSVSRKWRWGIRAPHAYAASVVHLSFLIGLLAHLVGGLAGEERGQLVVGPNWTALGDGREARVTALDARSHPDGSQKQVRATLDLRGPEGRVEQSVVHYNGPLSAGLGTDLFLLLRAGELPVANLVRGEAQCAVGPEGRCHLGDVQVTVGHVQETRGPHGTLAHVQVRREPSGALRSFWLSERRPQDLGDGSALMLTGVERRPAVLLRRRHAPGNPWALLASLLLVGGLLLMWRRFLPARGGEGGVYERGS